MQVKLCQVAQQAKFHRESPKLVLTQLEAFKVEEPLEVRGQLPDAVVGSDQLAELGELPEVFGQRCELVVVDFQALKRCNSHEILWQAADLVFREVHSEQFATEKVQTDELQIHVRHFKLCLLRFCVKLVLACLLQ